MQVIDTKMKSQLGDIVFQFLNPHQYKVFVFGSRARGDNAQFSDIDIGIEGKKNVPGHIMSTIRGAFEDSNLPYFVDVVDFSRVANDFRKTAKRDIVYLN